MTDVRISSLVKSFAGKPPTVALRGVDLDVPSGSLVAVLGPSGCGKTTMLRIIAGFERPDDGSVQIGDRVVASRSTHVPPERRRVAIVPQEGALFPHLDVAGNVAFGLRSMPRADRARRVAEMLDLVGLEGFDERRPDELSGGQQQRVALARALAPDPAVILLDEPFTALDAALRVAVRAEVAGLLKRANATAILVTHDQDEAFSMADTIAVMRSGEVVQHAAPEQLYRAPADLEVARFVGDVTEVQGRLVGDDRVRCGLGVLPVASAGTGAGDATTAAGSPVTVVVRPEQIVLADDTADPAAVVDAIVLGEIFHGRDVLVSLAVGDEIVTARWPGTIRPRVGDAVRVTVRGEALVFP